MVQTVKRLLGLNECVDATTLLLLDNIIELTTKRLNNLLGGVETTPPQLEYVVIEVSIIRFNRIGSEGVSSHSVEGESQTFTDDDFKAYSKDIQAFLERQKEGTKGRLRFI